MKMDVSNAIRMKRAIRQFNPQPLTKKEVEAILNAGRRAQSSKNTQPWNFIAIQDADLLEKLSELGTFAGHLAGASLGVAILTPEPSQRWSVMFDAGQAAAYMQLAAWELGIGSCIATIYEPEAARELLGFPEDQHLRSALSFGYPENSTLLSAPPQKGGRRGFEEVVRYESW
jgi:nitroreductase